MFLAWNYRYEEQFDDYNIIMVKATADRLAEVGRGILLMHTHSHSNSFSHSNSKRSS